MIGRSRVSDHSLATWQSPTVSDWGQQGVDGEMDEITIDCIVLRSANDKHRIRIELTADGSLTAAVLVPSANDPEKWEPQHSGQGTKVLAQRHLDSNNNVFHLL